MSLTDLGSLPVWPGVRRAGPAKAEPGADAGPGAAQRRRLISYGSIRQWSGEEPERQVGEARHDAVGSCGSQALVGVRCDGVADGIGTKVAGGLDAKLSPGDKGTTLRRGALCENCVFD